MTTEQKFLYTVGGISLLLLILEAAVAPLQGFTIFDPIALGAVGWGFWRLRFAPFSVLNRLVAVAVVALIVKHGVCSAAAAAGYPLFAYVAIPAVIVAGVLTFNFLSLYKKQKDQAVIQEKLPVLNVKDEKYPITFDDLGRVFLTTKAQEQHTQILGSSGSGKSVLMKRIMYQMMKRGCGQFIYDPKSDFSRTIAYYARLTGRTTDFRLFDIGDPERSQSFNPLHGSDADEVYNKMLIMLFPNRQGENPFYYALAKEVISNLASLILKEESAVTFSDYKQILSDEITSFKTLGYLCARYPNTNASRYFTEHWMPLDPEKRHEKLAGLLSRVGGFCGRKWSNLINVRDPQITMKDVMDNNRILVYGTSVMSGIEDAKALSIAAIMDMGPVIARRLKDPPDVPFYLMLDEFYNLAFPDFVETINKCRAARVPCILAHQSLGDLKAVSDVFCSQILDNTSSKVLLPVSSVETVDYFAKMFGTVRVEIPVYSYTATGSVAGSSVRPDERFRFNPNYLKDRNVGHAVVLSRWPVNVKDQRVMAFEVKVDREPLVPGSFKMDDVAPLRHLDRFESKPITRKDDDGTLTSGAKAAPKGPGPKKPSVDLSPKGKYKPSPLAAKLKEAVDGENRKRIIPKEGEA